MPLQEPEPRQSPRQAGPHLRGAGSVVLQAIAARTFSWSASSPSSTGGSAAGTAGAAAQVIGRPPLSWALPGLGQGEEVGHVRPPQRRLLATRCLAFQSVFLDRLQHHQALLPAGAILRPQQVLVDQRSGPVEHVEPEGFQVAGRAAHCLRRLQRAAAGEHGQPPEQPSLGRVEQLVAPPDRVAQCLVAGWRVRAAPVSSGRRRSSRASSAPRGRSLHPRRRQLDGQGQAVQPPAHPGHGQGVLRCEGEARIGVLRALNEERHGRVPREALRLGGRRRLTVSRVFVAPGQRPGEGIGKGQPGTGTSRSPARWRGARLVARTLSPGQASSSRATRGAAPRTCSKLSSRSSTRRSPSQSVRRSAVGRLPVSSTPRDPGDGGAHQGRIGERLQRDEHRAVWEGGTDSRRRVQR